VLPPFHALAWTCKSSPTGKSTFISVRSKRRRLMEVVVALKAWNPPEPIQAQFVLICLALLPLQPLHGIGVPTVAGISRRRAYELSVVVVQTALQHRSWCRNRERARRL
jgi:hypothetical protein